MSEGPPTGRGTSEGLTGEAGERIVAYYCPYCGGQDLRPHEAVHGAWECRECTRVFSVGFVGMMVVAR